MTKAELYQKACMLPLLPGVYIIRDKSGEIIYIGKAKRLRTRVSQYFREGVPHDNKVTQMIAHAFSFDVIVCQSEFEALVLEASQIKAHTPKYNILLKDDKGYSYIKVTREAWPRLSFTLQKEEDGAEYIGPYTSSFAAREMAESAQDAFLLPRCSRRFPQDLGKGRPCLNAHIGKCMGVCSGRISCEEYNQAVRGAVHLIRYGKKDILKTLTQRMQEASERLEFETAALLRDQIAAITKVTEGQKVVVDESLEMDVVALAGTPDSVCAAVLRYRHGRLTDKREFVFHDRADLEEIREEFLPRYYLDDEEIPKIIAVDALPPDADALRQALSEKRGQRGAALRAPAGGQGPPGGDGPHQCGGAPGPGAGAGPPGSRSCWTSWPRCWACPPPPTASRATTSPTGATAPASAAWWCSGTASPARRTTAASRCGRWRAPTTMPPWPRRCPRRAGEYAARSAAGETAGFAEKPDLLLMDGGRGQVNAAKEALAGTALAGGASVRHGQGQPPPHPGHRGRGRAGDRHQHEPRHLHLYHRHPGRDPPLCQRLPQAADAQKELFQHPDPDPRGWGPRSPRP